MNFFNNFNNRIIGIFKEAKNGISCLVAKSSGLIVRMWSTCPDIDKKLELL